MPLKGVPKILSPDLLKILSSMGHGDEIILADAHFPSSSVAKRSDCDTIELRSDACSSISTLLDAILKFFPLDQYDDSPAMVMDLVPSDKAKGIQVKAWKDYESVISNAEKKNIPLKYLERFEFYERAKKAYAIVHTGDVAIYANIILKKGVVHD